MGGKSNEDWVEVGRKKIKDGIAAIFAEFRREQAALRIKERNNIDSNNRRNLVIEKAESTSVCFESIKSKEASTIEKGHDEHMTVLDFSEAKGTYFPPYGFRATEIDEHQEQSDMAKQNLVNDEHQE